MGAGDRVGPGRTVGLGDAIAGVAVAWAVGWLTVGDDEHPASRPATATAMNPVFIIASLREVRVIKANNDHIREGLRNHLKRCPPYDGGWMSQEDHV